MRISSETALLDANILIHAVDRTSPKHTACLALLNRGQAGDLEVCLAPQVLFEFFAVVTSPTRTRHPRSIEEALQESEKFADAFPMIHPPTDVHQRVVALYRQTPLGITQIFDAVLAATIFSNGLTKLYSLDAGFDHIPGIIRLTP